MGKEEVEVGVVMSVFCGCERVKAAEARAEAEGVLGGELGRCA